MNMHLCLPIVFVENEKTMNPNAYLMSNQNYCCFIFHNNNYNNIKYVAKRMADDLNVKIITSVKKEII